MKNSHLIKLLETFEPKEIKRFDEFISSPFFNKNKNVIKLFGIIKKAYPDFKQEKVARENVFSKIFPGKKYNGNTLRVLTHLLYEGAREFIAYTRFKKNIYAYKEELTVELYERELYNESIKVSDKAISELDKSKLKDSDYFLNKYQFENYKFFCTRRIKQEKLEKFIDESIIETPFKNLLYYFFSKMLDYYSIALNIKNIYNTDNDLTLFEKLFPYFDNELYKESPFIQMYYNIVMILKTNDEKYFYTVKNLVQKYEKSLNLSELFPFYTYMENFCSRKIIAGEKHFRRELFEILKLNIEKKIYKAVPFMNHILYKNALTNATQLKEFDWAENFIESCKNELHPYYREAVYCFCKAFIEAMKNNYEESLDYLAKLKTDELYLKIDVKLLEVRLYYELNWYDVLNSAIDSIKHSLKSYKFIPKDKKTRFSNYIKFLSALNNTRLKKDEMKITELKEKIHKTTELQWKDWLIEKVEELDADL